MCMAAENCKLQERVDAIDERVNRLETRMADGFQTVTAAVNNLSNDFGSRMNTLDKRIVEEKAKENERRHDERSKWGDSCRRWLDLGVKVILAGCLAAMGMTAYKMIFGN